MIKAKLGTASGRPLYLLGLDAENRRRIAAGQFIDFDGSELGLPGHWFLLACNDDDPSLERLRKRLQVEGQKLHSFGFSKATLRMTDCVEVDGARIGLDGDVAIVLADSNADIAAALGIATTLPAPGERFDFDPLTGEMVRSAVRPS